MRSGARIDRRDAEFFRWIEAAAKRYGSVEISFTREGNPALPWWLHVSDGNRNGDTELLGAFRDLRAALEQARKDRPLERAKGTVGA